jgi:hypothetical protein
MGGRSTGPRLLSALLLGVALASASGADERNREIVRRDCSTRLGRNEVTLFGNGTVRLREWTESDTGMRLAELGIDEVAAYERRLAELDLRESAAGPPAGVSGEWIERCELTYNRAGSEPRKFRYGRMDTQSLAVASLLRIVDELAELAAKQAFASGLPPEYEPRRGDLLARADGAEFEIVGFTLEGQGVELRGRLDPLTIYVPRADLRQLFVQLVRRAP